MGTLKITLTILRAHCAMRSLSALMMTQASSQHGAFMKIALPYQADMLPREATIKPRTSHQ